ncbi:unnamed protein product [Triticum turgidum subsp. durum]|uniref:GDSL esterase/lipase n=1 Tax=Triticum turgidum subsp. durum TaxID=4567 RepID=A0A9R0ZRS3_TRITD|nr:unnamed protein product [Triticum turgidum subsp. durum]
MRIASAWQLLLSAVLCCCCCIDGAAGQGWRCRFPAVFNFGDSNSDTGGFWAAFPAQPPPFGVTYFGRPAGRASDGRLVIDFIAQAMGLPLLSPYLRSVGSDFRHGANFATLASTALLPNTSLFVTGISPFSLAIQLRQMKELSNRAIASGATSGQLPPPDIFGNSLYTIDIGQNDFTSNLGSQSIGSVKRTLPSVISQISWAIQDLHSIGARKFMVFNMAPIGCYPAFLVELPHSSNDLDEYGCMASYNSAVVYYNELLNNSLAEVRKTLQNASIVYVDKYSAMLELFRHPEDHGLKYGTKACCGYGGGAYNFDPDLYCGTSKIVKGNIASATACGDPQNYVSWDGIHATEAANNIIASALMSGYYSYPPSDLSKLCRP